MRQVTLSCRKLHGSCWKKPACEDTVARVGGDEFVLIFKGLLNRGKLTILADRLIENCASPCVLRMIPARFPPVLVRPCRHSLKTRLQPSFCMRLTWRSIQPRGKADPAIVSTLNSQRRANRARGAELTVKGRRTECRLTCPRSVSGSGVALRLPALPCQ